MQRVPQSVIAAVDLGFGVKKPEHAIEGSFLASQVQRGAPEVISSLDVCLIVNKKAQDFVVVVCRGKVHRCAVLVRERVNIGSGLNQCLGGIVVSRVAGVVQGAPPIRIQVVDVGVAIFNDALEGVLFCLGLFVRENHFVDRCFSSDALTVVDTAATVDEVLDVFTVGLLRGFIQVLENIARELILAHVERPLSESSRERLGPLCLEQAALLEGSEVAGNVERRLIVLILLVEYLL